MRTFVKTVDVCKTYQIGEVEIEVLCGLDLEIRKGEFLAIMGKSGSGKSTSMNIIGCLDVPSKGIVYLEGSDISKLSESNLATIRGKKIGFVFQNFNLIPTLSALENVMLPMIFQEIPEKERVERAIELLKMLELGDRINNKPLELSGGEQQRVAIARALANNPEAILADEPTGNLDTKTGELIMKILGNLHKKGKTVILITHDTSLAKYAQRIVYIQDGRFLKEVKNVKK